MQLELNHIQTNMTKTLSARSAGDFCTKYKQITNKIRPENLLGAERRSNFRQFWDPGDVSFVPTVGHRTLAMMCVPTSGMESNANISVSYTHLTLPTIYSV